MKDRSLGPGQQEEALMAPVHMKGRESHGALAGKLFNVRNFTKQTYSSRYENASVCQVNEMLPDIPTRLLRALALLFWMERTQRGSELRGAIISRLFP